MEHFLYVEGTETIRPVGIPYLCTDYDHDDGAFMSYPLRRGWSGSPIIKHSDLLSRSPQEANVFFQAWLYFGCLKEVFRVVGLQVYIKDFIRVEEDNEKYVTTCSLPVLIEKWRDRENSPEDISVKGEGHGMRNALWATMVESKAGRRILISSILNTVQHNINRFCDDKIPPQSRLRGPILPQISLSIIALGWTLQRAAFAIYEPSERPRQRWGSLNPILKMRSLEAGWCYSDIKKLTEYSNVAALYYLGSSPSPQMHYDHIGCTETACYASRGDMYRQRSNHVLPSCDCNYVSVPSDILNIIDRGNTPFLSWSESEQVLITHEHESQSKMKYIAISHVWSDGLGNMDNSLPMCQLHRIQKIVDHLYPELQHTPQKQHAPTSNGVIGTTDSLQQPMGFWIDTLCVPIDPKHRKYRKLVIHDARRIFKNAHAVLVLDSWVQTMSYSADITAKALRIYSCNWMRSLWTLEQGTLAQTLFYRFRDGAQTLQDLEREQKIDEASCPGFYCRIAGLILPLLVVNLKENLPLPLRFLSVLMRTGNRADLFRESDETILLSSILELDSAPLFDTTDWEEGVAEARMEIFLQMIEKFPAEIIFNAAPRLHKEGFRWAPISFLRYRPNLPALEVAKRDYKRGKFATLSPDQGLVVTFPGIAFQPVESRFRTPFRVMLGDHHTVFYVTLQPDEDGQYPWWDPGQRYGIVVNGSGGIYPGKADAIMGILDPEQSGETLRLVYRSRVKVELSDLEELSFRLASFEGADKTANEECGPLLRGEWVQEDQKWCVC